MPWFKPRKLIHVKVVIISTTTRQLSSDDNLVFVDAAHHGMYIGLLIQKKCQMRSLQNARWWFTDKTLHDDVIKWKHFLLYWPFVRGIHRSPHKDQWRGALMFSLICVWINGWVTIVRLVIWDAIALIMTSLYWEIQAKTGNAFRPWLHKKFYKL